MLDCCRCFDDEGPDEQEDSRDDERYRQQLTHIQCHSLFEADLRFLDKFDQEAHSEAAYEEESEEESAVNLVELFGVNPYKYQSQNKIAERFVYLCRVFGLCFSAQLEDESPRERGDVSVDLAVH